MPRERKQVERFKATPQVQKRVKKEPQAQAQAQAQPQRQQQRQQQGRSLNLKLTKVETNEYDTADPTSEFYDKYFIKPNDDITKRLDELDYSKHAFNVSLQSGITNFDLKDIDTIELKPVSFAKFKNGDYQTDKSSSDDIYTDRIQFFLSRFPSFEKYRTEDSLHWIIRENRLLMCELLEYSLPKRQALSSIEGRVNAMMRVMLIAFGTKLHPLYIKYQTLLQEMRNDVKKKEGDNTLNEAELAKGGLIPWPDVLERQKQLEQAFNTIANKQTREAYALNQDLVLLSLYTLIPPLRNEPKTLEYTHEKQYEGDWILFETGHIYLDLNEEKKKHDSIKIKVPDNLKLILQQSYVLYKRQYVFTDTLKYPDLSKKASLSTMNNRLQNLFKGSQYKVGASMLRSSFITHTYDTKKLTYNQKEALAKQMRTSREMFDLNYYKILTQPMPAVVIDETVERKIAEPAKGVPVVGKMAMPMRNQPLLVVNRNTRPRKNNDDTYLKHLERQKAYYEKYKDKILKKQRTYRKENRPEMNKRKILSYLNGSKAYKARQTTLDKYGIKLVDGVYV